MKYNFFFFGTNFAATHRVFCLRLCNVNVYIYMYVYISYTKHVLSKLMCMHVLPC